MNPVTALTAIPYDKSLHILAGTLTFAGCKLAQFSDNVCLATAILAGVAKEVVHDKWMHLGNPDRWDAIATGVGGVIGYVITIKF